MTTVNTPNAKLLLKSGHAENWTLEKGRITYVKAKAGSQYRVIVNAEGKEIDATEVFATRHADDLHIEVLGDSKVVLENFYGECRNAACVVELAGDKPAGYAISGDSPVGAALGDGGGLVYAYGESNPLLQTLGVSENLAGFSTQASMSTYIPPESHAAFSNFAGAFAGGIGMAAAMGTATASGIVAYTITVTAVAGRFNAADQVHIFDKDGNFLATGQLDPATGQYAVSITNGYRGPILVKVIDSNGSSANFSDESTGAARSLNTELRAMAIVDGSVNFSITVSPLTELAVRNAGITGNVVTEANVMTNQKIGRLFGLSDINGPALTVVESGYNESDGVSSAEQYGKVLAALSGADDITGSVDATLDRLQTAIVPNPSDSTQLAIKQSGVDLIDSGATRFESGPNATQASLNIQNSQKAPWVVGASDGLNTTTEVGSGTSVKTEITGATAGTVITVTWGNQSFDYTITVGDVTAGVATIPVASSVIAAAGEGELAITTKVGTNPVSPAVLIVVDTSAPTAGPDLVATSDIGSSSTDNLTSDTTPTLNVGQLPSGVTAIELLANGVVVASSYNSSTGEITPNSALGDGSQVLSYRYVRGNFTGAASPSLTVSIDSTPPTAPTITGVADNTAPITGTVADGDATNDRTPTITGTAEAGATITLYNGSAILGTTTADGSGNWSFTPANALGDGSYTINAKATDAAGNESPASTVRALTIDTAVPSAPTSAPDLTAASDTGSSTDNLTSDTTPSLTVTAPAAGETVRLYVNGVEVAATYNSTTGEVTPTSPLGDGVKTIAYSYVDAAGNESPQSPALAVTIDSMAASDPTVNPSGGKLLTGNAEPGATVTLNWTDGTPQTATVTADANGSWRYPATGLLSPGIPNGTVISVASTDAAGNPAAQPVSLTVNTLPPTLDTITDNVGHVTGNVANGASSDDTTPTLSGTAGTAGGATGDVLKVYNGTNYLGDATVNTNDGTWTFTPSSPLAEGPLNLNVKWVTSSNAPISSGASAVFSMVVDTTGPSAPVNAPDLIAADDSGSSATDNVTSVTKPTINLGAGLIAGDVAQVVVYLDGNEITGTYNPTTGDFVPAAAIAEGVHSVSFKLADAAGNLSTASPALSITIDITVPSTPTSASDLTTASDTGSSDSDNNTVDNTPSFAVAAPASGEIVKLFVDGVEVAATYANGEITPTVTLGDGVKSITYKYADAAGNLSTASPALSITIDTTAPQRPSAAPDLTTASDTGVSTTDNITSDTTPSFAITAPATGETVKLYVDGIAVAASVVGGEITPNSPLPDGPHAIAYSYVDAAGNESSVSPGINVTIDTTAPADPSANPSGGRLLTGAADPGSIVTLTWTPSGGTLQTATVTANANGGWRYPDTGVLTTGIPDGTVVTVSTADPAGNTSANTATVTVSITGPTIDSVTDDVARVLGTVANNGSTNDTQPTLAGTVGTNTGATAGDYLRIFNGSTYLGDAVVDTVNGTWSFTPATALAEGTYNLKAQWVTGGTANINDGNNASNGASSVVNFTIDTTAPVAPTAPDLLAASDTGSSDSDNNTVDNTPSFTVAAPASGHVIKLYVDGVEVAATYSNGTLTPTLPLSDGVHAITYGYVDAAGNIGAKSPALTVTIDTAVPSAPTSAPDLVATSDTGVRSTDDNTSDNTPSFTVTGPATGEVIKLYVDGVEVAATYGNGTLTPNAALADGVHAITYGYVDAAGNVGAKSPALSVTVDTALPATPLNGPDLTAASDTGSSATDNLTNDTTPSLAIGQLPAGISAVKLYVDGVAVAATYDPSTGQVTPTTALGEGVKAITYTLIDTAGNESPASPSLAVTIDTTGPVADPTANPSSGKLFGGTAEPGGTVTLNWTEGGVAKTATVVANNAGTWTYSPPTQVPNTTVVTVTAADPAGNPAPHTAAVTVDINAPSLDSVVDNLAPNTGEVANGGATNDPTLVLSGSIGSASGNYLRVFDGSTYLGDATIDNVTGTWSFTTPTLSTSIHSFQVKWTSGGTAGNNDGTLTSNGASSVRDVVVDATAPAAPAITTVTDDLAPTTGTVANAGATNDTTPTIAGTAEAYATVKLYNGSTLIGTTTADGSGNWTFTPSTALAAGAYSLTAKATDAAGNESTASSARTFTIDTTAPAAPAITSVTDDMALVTGTVANAGITNDATPTVAGTTEANATVSIYNGSTLIGTTTADGSGNWTFTPSAALAEGAYSLTAKATDTAGNESVASSARAFTVDTTAPSTPAITSVTDDAAPNTGAVANAATTNDNTPTIAGTADANTTVSIYNGSTLLGTTTADANGAWTYTPSTVLADGSYTLTAKASDTAGNQSAASSPGATFTIQAATAIKLSSIESGVGGLVINGFSASDLSGISVASAGDVNGDGIDDIVIGAVGADTAVANAGKTYVIYGRTDITPSIELSDIAAGSGGFVINGASANHATGMSATAAGDLNGDGLSDLLIGASDNGSRNGANRAYVVYGKTGTSAVELSAVDAGNGGFAMLGTTSDQENAGYSVASAGDINGDGIADLLVGAPYGNVGGGLTYAVFGGTNLSSLNLTAIGAGNGGFVISGSCGSERTGYSVSAAGDVNGDGLADMIIGEYGMGLGQGDGASYVVFGKTGTTAVNLSALGAQGFKINGESGSYSSAGISVANAGDVNGDGLADVIVGAQRYDANGRQDTGRSYVIFGTTASTTVNLSAIAGGTGGFAINGLCLADESGTSVAAAGDINGDGLADLLIGAREGNTSAGSAAGRTYVVYGKTGTTAVQVSDIASTQQGGFVLEGVTLADGSGNSVSAAGDVNGDGFDDLLIGAYLGDPNISNRVNAGKTYLIFGGSQFMTTVDFLGDATANTQAGTTASETFIGGAGNDTITGGGGADVMFGGSGDDTFNLDAENIAKLAAGLTDGQLARIDGGNGVDTIALAGSGLTLNLRQIANQAAGNPDGGSRIDSVERINLTGTGNNTLTLDPVDIRDMAGMNLFNDGNGWTGLGATVQKHQLLVDGNAGDVINASGYWNAAGTVTVNGQTYAVYNDTSSAAQLLVDTDITRNIPPPPLALSSVNAGINGFAINGESSNTFSGSSVANAGDVNGDGLDDLIVGTPNLGTNTGRSYVVFGKTSGTAVELSAVSPTATGVGGFAIYGESASDQSGISVSTAGDMNGDGLADLLVGAYNSSAAGTQSGRSYVVYGKTGTGAVHLSAIAATAGSSEGFVINAQGASSWTAHSVAAAGDVNGDGFADLVIGADQRTPSNGLTKAGASYVIFGSATPAAVNLSAVAATSSPAGGFVINGQGASDWSGYSVSGAGDVNGDGLADVIVGAYNSDPAGRTDAGRSYVVYGKTGTAAVELSDVAAGNGGFVINGAVAYDNNGVSVANAGDVNGDGLADLIVGAVYTGAGLGKSYVVFGKTGTSAIELSAVAGGTGGFLLAPEVNGDNSGFSVASAGDMNGDGLADLIVGANWRDRTYIVYGKTDSTTVQLSAVAAGNGGVLITGQSENSGTSVSAAGDVNGDGLADVIVGANTANTVAGGSSAGRSYVIFGSTGGNFAGGTTVDVFGTMGNDTLADSGVAKTIVADQGNDTITATAASVVYAGAGDDNVVIDAAMITALQAPLGSGGNVGQLVRVDGGNGIDTLSLAGAGLTLNLRQVANQAAANPDGGSRLDSIEKIDLTGTGNNTLTLDPADIRDMAGMNLFNASNGWTALGATVQKHQLLVDGDTGDVLNASGTWTTGGSITVNGQTYAVYNDTASAAQLLVDADITSNITVVTPPPTLVSSSPADNATGVAASSNIVLTFSESVVAGTGNIEIHDLAGNVLTIPIADPQVTISGNTVTINPSSDLTAGRTYYVTMAAGAVKNAANIDYAGIADATTLNFNVPVPAVGVVELSNITLGVGGFAIDDRTGSVGARLKVSNAGDVNGDGLDDLLIGYPDDYVNYIAAGTGRTYVVFGKTDNTYIDLTQLSPQPSGVADALTKAGTGGFVINSVTSQEFNGMSVSAAGDLNGDGLADLLVGASGADIGANVDAGAVYVVYGKTSTSPVTLTAIAGTAAQNLGFIIRGGAGNERLGLTVSSAGDVNGDGLDDLLVGGTLKSYVVFGQSGNATINVTSLGTLSQGFAINNSAGLQNLNVSQAGDVNGDGLADLVLGFTGAASPSYVIFGKTSNTTVDLTSLATTANTNSGFVINGVCSASGTNVSSAGDVNGDGLADLIIGAPAANTPIGASAGRSYVVFGKTSTSAINLTAIAATSGAAGGFVIDGASALDGSGISVSAAGDVNGDGLGDLLVGASLADPRGGISGQSYVVYGKAGTDTVQLSALNSGVNGFIINGECQGDQSGITVSAAGDVNGDGLADLIVGEKNTDSRSYVIFGGQQFMTAVDYVGTASADTITGTASSETLIASGGDDMLTGNGGADVMYAGAGNDVLVLNADNISKLSAGITDGKLARFDGGTGLDTLQVMGGASLDLTAIANVGGGTPDGFSRIESIEKIDLATDTAANTLTVRAKDVIDMSGMNLFNVDGNTATPDAFHQLMIKGDVGDTVNIGSGWTATAITYTDATDSNRTYKVYQDDATHTQLLIDNTIVTASHVI